MEQHLKRLVVVWCPSLLEEGEWGEEVRSFADLLSVAETFCPWVEVVRLGICAMPARGPSRFFGGERPFVDRLRTGLLEVGLTGGVHIGVADGLFAAMLAARAEIIVPSGETVAFLAPWSVSVLGHPELAMTLQRLGVHRLGQFAELPTRHILSRFGADAALCHRVAKGEEGELAGQRDLRAGQRLRTVRNPSPDSPRQPGFFGGASAVEARAATALSKVQQILAPEAVVVGRLQGGRGPAERARLVPWGSRDTDPTRVPASPSSGAAPSPPSLAAPWPGQLPSPSPITVLASPARCELIDADGRAVAVTGRGLLTEKPWAVSIGGEAWSEIGGWAGPWPVTERWWSARRRRARLQVVTRSGGAFLLAAERRQWWLEAVYD